MSDTGRVPPSLQLATSIPIGIRGYRRRCVTSAQSIPAGGVTPGSYVNVYLDTSTPGTFLDPEGSYLEFDVTFVNECVNVDYQNFSLIGCGPSLIQEMRIYNQGTPMEEILEYPTACTCLENIEANQELDVYFYFSSCLKQGFQKSMHKNFIKPPMVDRGGNIMFGPNPQGLGINFHSSSNSQYTNAYCNQTCQTSGTTFTSLPAPDGSNQLLNLGVPVVGANAGFTVGFTDQGSVNLALADTGMPAPASTAGEYNPGLISSSYFYAPVMRQMGSGGSGVVNFQQAAPSNYNPSNSVLITGTGLPLYAVAGNFGGLMATSINLNGTTWGTSMTLSSCTQSPPFCSTVIPVATSSFTLPTKWANELQYVVAITPMDFPDKFSPDMVDIVSKYVREYGTINKQSVMDNLCNVKCFPIGMIPTQAPFNTAAYGQPEPNVYQVMKPVGTGSTTVSGASINAVGPAVDSGNGIRTKATAPAPSNPTYRVCFRLTSGILGKLATKMLALCLLSPNQLYLNLRLADASTVYKVTADPCRRISGTIRDYIRNIGQLNGAVYASGAFQKGFQVPDPYAYTLTSFAPGYSPSYCIPVNQATMAAWDQMASVSTIFSEASTTGKCLTTDAVHLVPPGFLNPPSTQCYVESVNDDGDPISGTTGNNQKGLYAGIPALGAQLITNTPSGNIKVNQPAPQYALTLAPWMFKAINAYNSSNPNITYANEGQVFYGTSLECSVPQSARIFQMGFDGRPESGWYGESPQQPSKLTYAVSNINFVYDEIIVSESITADIIMQAESGDYNVHTNSVRTYNVSVTSGTTQNILIPAKISYAKRIFFIFQNMKQRTSYIHDSNSGINPFALVQSNQGSPNTQVNIPNNTTNALLPCGYQSSACGAPPQATTLYGCGMSQPLSVTPTPVSAGAFSAQLQIGNEFIPPQPLQSIAEIVAENMKTVEGWSKSSYSPNIQSDAIVSGSSANLTSTGYTNSLAFDCFKDKGFTTAFIPTDCLDDQTITGNFDFAPLFCYYPLNPAVVESGVAPSCTELTIGNPSKATRNSAMNGFNHICPRGYCLQGLYEPPSSTFFLGFNLRSWKTTDGVESGMYLGNNNIFLKLTGAIGLSGANQTYRLVCVIPHRAVMKYSANGVLTWIY